MGAQTTLHLCYESYENIIDGGYFDNCAMKTSSGESDDMIKCNRFVRYCGNLVEMNANENYQIMQLNYLKYLKEQII